MSASSLTPEELKLRLSALPLWPEFTEGDKDVDGLIPSCRVESWEDFIAAMRDPQHNRASSEWIYRGQRGGDWPLASTLGRKFNGGSIPSDKRDGLLAQFELAMRGRGYDLSTFTGENADIEKWAIGQHHDLLTPLLDWTRSPFIALFFAFRGADNEAENPSRAVYCVNMSAIRNAWEGERLFFDPMGHNNSRLVNQAGLFTMIPDNDDNFASYIINKLQEEGVVSAEPVTNAATVANPDTGEAEVEYSITDNLSDQLKRYIQKIHIPNTARLDCLATLRKMNIHNGTLFPDAQGASLYCNDWLERILQEEKEELAQIVSNASNEVAVAKAKEGAAAAPDVVGAILSAISSFGGGDEATYQTVAERLHEKFLADRSYDWHLSSSKTAKVRVGQLRILKSFEFPEPTAEDIANYLVEFLKNEEIKRPPA